MGGQRIPDDYNLIKHKVDSEEKCKELKNNNKINIR